MNQIIIFPNSETAGICVLHPVPDSGLTMQEIAEKDVPSGVNFAVVDASELPADKYFRNAWRLGAFNKISIDIQAAKEIQRNYWREARVPKLAALDIQFMQALEAGNSVLQTNISETKQALRDVTLTELPDDINGIRATWPAILA
jgi:hypothetical protein